MDGKLNWRNFFGAVDRFRERIALDRRDTFDLELLNSLTSSQQRLIRELVIMTDRNSEGVSLKSLAEDLHLSSSAVSVMVELLVNKKVLERSTSTVDRRQVLIRLSDLTWQAVDAFDDFFDSFIKSLPDEENKIFQHCIEKFIIALNNASINNEKTIKQENGKC